MPFSVQKFLAAETSLTVVIDGDEINLSYRPNALTPDLAARLTGVSSEVSAQSAQEIAKEAQHHIHALFIEVVTAWDVPEEEGGAPIPLELEWLDAIPGLFWLELRLLKFLREEVSDLGGVTRKSNGHLPGTSAARAK